MAKFVLGNTNRKGCSVCGKQLYRLGRGQALVLDGSSGKVAVCSQACVDKYSPESGDTAKPADGGADAAKAKKPKPKAK